jgi:hypothetical protein
MQSGCNLFFCWNQYLAKEIQNNGNTEVVLKAKDGPTPNY